MRTRLVICQEKQRFGDHDAAMVVAAQHGYAVRPYACDRCGAFHLTSRRTGKRIPRPIDPQ